MTPLPLITALGLMLAAAAPAVAHDAELQASARHRLLYDARSQRYCAAATVTGADTITGSVLPHRQCRTREQWAAKGVAIPRS